MPHERRAVWRNWAANRHFSFFWCQSDEAAGAYGLPVPAGVRLADRCWSRRLNVVDGPADAPQARVDRS